MQLELNRIDLVRGSPSAKNFGHFNGVLSVKIASEETELVQRKFGSFSGPSMVHIFLIVSKKLITFYEFSSNTKRLS